MKKNNKKILIIISIVVLSVSILLATIFIINITKDKKMSEENMQIIKDNYNELSVTVSEYNQIRTNLSELLNNFIYDKYSNEHEKYTELLNKYNNSIENIDNNIDKISTRCEVIYNDISVNKICDSYKVLYEKLINLYVIDLNNYNDKINGYNEYKENNEYQLFELIHKDYIDYNNDNKYEGKDVSNEED